jgi:branched-chain amino acid transport system substrate-binding protein
LIGEPRAGIGSRVPILAPEFLPISALFEAGGGSVRGAYVSRLGLTLDRLPREGRRFLRDFAPIQPGGKMDVFAAYAAQATEVLLDAIARSDGSRVSVVKQLFSLRVRQGILGDFRFTSTGDITQQPITILRAQTPGGARTIQGYEGGVIDRVIRPPPGLAR